MVNRAAVLLIYLLVACQRINTTSRILEDEGVPVDQGRWTFSEVYIYFYIIATMWVYKYILNI